MKKLFILSIAALMAVSVSCNKDKLVTVTTGELTWLGSSSADLNGSFSTGKKISVSEYGFFVTGNFGIGEEKMKFPAEGGKFLVELSSLLSGEKYSYTAYAIADDELYFGQTKHFRTYSEEGYNKSAVDFGTGVVWALTNVGASFPTDYGDYFAWGETEPKTEYSEENYVHPGVKMLSGDNDPCTVNLGGFWRTPTYEEYKALREATSYHWTVVSSVNGLKLSGKGDYVDANIFFPAAGMYYPQPTGFMGAGTECDYASASITEDPKFTNPVWELSYNSGTGAYNIMLAKFFWGLPYRAVMDADKYEMLVDGWL